MDLSGLWNYRLDPNDKGESEGWFTEQFALQSFQLPGTTAENKIGTKLDRKLEKEWTKDAVASFREYYSYRGVLWLQREVVLDQAPELRSFPALTACIKGCSATSCPVQSHEPVFRCILF